MICSIDLMGQIMFPIHIYTLAEFYFTTHKLQSLLQSRFHYADQAPRAPLNQSSHNLANKLRCST
jgi:hypothetical protein